LEKIRATININYPVTMDINPSQHVPQFDIDQFLYVADFIGVDLVKFSNFEMIEKVCSAIIQDAAQPTPRKNVIIYAKTPYKLKCKIIAFSKNHDSLQKYGEVLQTSEFFYQIIKIS